MELLTLLSNRHGTLNMCAIISSNGADSVLSNASDDGLSWSHSSNDFTLFATALQENALLNALFFTQSQNLLYNNRTSVLRLTEPQCEYRWHVCC